MPRPHLFPRLLVSLCLKIAKYLTAVSAAEAFPDSEASNHDRYYLAKRYELFQGQYN
jgi:hypothetical protein